MKAKSIALILIPINIILAFFVYLMYRSGTKIVKQREEKENIKQVRGIHQRIGDFLVWLLIAVVFLGFLRLLDILQ